MVASKNKKAVKLSYAERVLGSFSQIQREHKKHAIHLASLKAQIQKTATSRKDKLGPNWKSWVTRAVHRFEEDGILAPAPAEPGSYILTTNGKKLIDNARRVLQLPGTDSLSKEQKDLLWKQVTHPMSGPAVKRLRHPDGSDNEEDDEYVPPKSSKRPRISTASAHKTKAQLVEEIAILERAREADRLRAESPLTVLDDDESEELARLKEILQHKEDEINDLRGQLADRSYDHDDPPYVDTTMVFSSTPRNAVVRTQSGSFIDQLSKRPTPAPTELDPNEYNLNEHHDDFVSVHFANSLVTPDATPAKNKQTTFSLDRPSAAEQLEHEISELALELSTKNARIDTLQTELSTYAALLLEKDGLITSHISSISSLERVKADLTDKVERYLAERGDLTTKLFEAEARGSGLDTKLADAKKESETSTRAAAEALKQISALDDALSGRISELQRVQEQLVQTQSELETSRLNAGILENNLNAARGAVDLRKAEGVQMADRIQELEVQLLDRDRLLIAASSAEKELQKAIEVARDDNAGLRDQLAASDAVKATLVTDLARVEAEARDLMQDKNLRIQQLEEQVHQLEQTLVDSVSAHNAAIAEKECLLSLARSDVDRLTRELLTAQEELAAQAGRLGGDLSRLTSAFENEKCRGERVETERAEAIALVEEVEGELLEMQAAKEADELTIQELKEAVSQLRTAQMASLAKLENKLQSAHSSPVPKRRTSRIVTRSA